MAQPRKIDYKAMSETCDIWEIKVTKVVSVIQHSEMVSMTEIGHTMWIFMSCRSIKNKISVYWDITNISEEHVASICRVEGCSSFFQNVGACLPDYMTTQKIIIFITIAKTT
jgi:hypothetical protein